MLYNIHVYLNRLLTIGLLVAIGSICIAHGQLKRDGVTVTFTLGKPKIEQLAYAIPASALGGGRK